MRTDQELAAYIGLDWGDQRPAVQIQPAEGGPVEQLELERRLSATAVVPRHEMAARCLNTSGNQRVSRNGCAEHFSTGLGTDPFLKAGGSGRMIEIFSGSRLQ